MDTPFADATSSLTEGRWQVITITEFGPITAGTFATEAEADALAYEMADDGYVSILNDSTAEYQDSSAPGSLYDWLVEEDEQSDERGDVDITEMLRWWPSGGGDS